MDVCLAKAFTVEAGEDIFKASCLCHSLPFQTNIKTVTLAVKGGSQVPTVTAFHRIYSWELHCSSSLCWCPLSSHTGGGCSEAVCSCGPGWDGRSPHLLLAVSWLITVEGGCRLSETWTPFLPLSICLSSC